MLNLIAIDERTTLELPRARTFRLREDEVLIIAPSDDIDEAVDWLDVQGLQGATFAPSNTVVEFSHYTLVETAQGKHAIRLQA